MEERKTTNSSGIGVTGLLGVAFIVLKLIGVIDWSWFWVLSPFWISLSIALLILGGVLLAAILKK